MSYVVEHSVFSSSVAKQKAKAPLVRYGIIKNEVNMVRTIVEFVNYSRMRPTPGTSG